MTREPWQVNVARLNSVISLRKFVRRRERAGILRRPARLDEAWEWYVTGLWLEANCLRTQGVTILPAQVLRGRFRHRLLRRHYA